MLINFTKMHVLGNDFVIVDQIRHRLRLRPEEIKRMADRKFGIGCDQLLIAEPPLDPEAVCFIRIFNQDGSLANQCGNGMRAAAKYAFDTGLTNKLNFKIQCQAGIYSVTIEKDNRVAIEISALNITVNSHLIPLFDQEIKVHSLSIGNSHIIYKVDDLNNIQVANYGAQIAQNKQIPPNSNINFMEIVTTNHIRLRVFENGVGETLACGSGACAAVIVGNYLSLLEAACTVSFKHGDLNIEYFKDKNMLRMQGPTSKVFYGKFYV